MRDQEDTRRYEHFLVCFTGGNLVIYLMNTHRHCCHLVPISCVFSRGCQWNATALRAPQGHRSHTEPPSPTGLCWEAAYADAESSNSRGGLLESIPLHALSLVPPPGPPSAVLFLFPAFTDKETETSRQLSDLSYVSDRSWTEAQVFCHWTQCFLSHCLPPPPV